MVAGNRYFTTSKTSADLGEGGRHERVDRPRLELQKSAADEHKNHIDGDNLNAHDPDEPVRVEFPHLAVLVLLLLPGVDDCPVVLGPLLDILELTEVVDVLAGDRIADFDDAHLLGDLLNRRGELGLRRHQSHPSASTRYPIASVDTLKILASSSIDPRSRQ